MSEQKNQSEVDELFNGVVDPIVLESGGFAFIGYVEHLILNSLNPEQTQNDLIDSLDTMRKSEMDILVVELKENQNYKDCGEQFKQMVRRGVFN